jgi:hypothetical protein
MTREEVTNQLQEIVSSGDFAGRSMALTDAWTTAGAGVETVEPILQFMEEHSAIDFGTPGPLVHFVERFYRNGYEDKLVESVQRRPTWHTVWMLNRVVNGTKIPEVKERLIAVMEEVKRNAVAHPNVLNQVDRYLELHSS